jgi:uncharacterized protein YndB with AHSA1/START domain
MKLTESLVIPAAAADIWGALADPACWPRWNPKIRSVTRDRSGFVFQRERFGALCVLGTHERPTEVEVVSCDPRRRLILREHYNFRSRKRSVLLGFELINTVGGARVTLTMNLRSSGIPWIFRLITAWVHRFGRPSGPSILDGLKELLTKPAAEPQSELAA